MLMISLLLWSTNYKPIFLIVVVLSMMCEGSMGAILPTVTIKHFGERRGHQVHSFMYAAFGTSSISSSIVVGFFGYKLGFSGILMICFFLCSISCFLTFLFNDTRKFDYKKLDKESYINTY